MDRRSAKRAGDGNREQIQALARGLQVLGYLNRVGIASNTLVAKRFHLKVSTAHRVLMVLTRMGILRHDLLSHQFMVASHVRTLSAGFHESELVDDVALPRMQAWTRRHGMRLLLVAEENGALMVLASTSSHWPLARELPVAGNILSEIDSSEAEILAQSGTDAVLRRRIVTRTSTAEQERQISVLVLTRGGFRGSLSIRCSTDIIGSPKAVRHWAAELRTLAATIVAANDR